MIKKSFLPNLSLCPRQISCLGQRLFEQTRPVSESEFRSSADEEMDMLGHDHVSTDGNIEVALGSPGKKDEGGVDLIAGQARPAAMRAEGDEVERTGVEDPAETERSSSKMIARKPCSDGAL